MIKFKERRRVEKDWFLFEEAPLKFPPTYKLVPNQGGKSYNLTRVPSWCDRVLFRVRLNANFMTP